MSLKNTPQNLITYCASKTDEELSLQLEGLRTMRDTLEGVDLSLPIEILEQIILTKSQGRYYIFDGEDMWEYGDGYLPDGFLLYQQIGTKRILTPILPSPDRNEYDPSRVVEDITEIINYLIEKKVTTLYTGEDNYNSLPRANSSEQHDLYVSKLEDYGILTALKEVGIEIQTSNTLV